MLLDTFESKTVDLDGPMHYADFGGSGPSIVLVHGLGSSHYEWLFGGPLLTEYGHVVAPDLAGFGWTPPAGRRSSVSANQRLLDRFIREVVGEAPVLVGSSMGGFVSILQAVRAPASISRLVLTDPALPLMPSDYRDPRQLMILVLPMVPYFGRRMWTRALESSTPRQQVEATLEMVLADASRVPEEYVLALAEARRERIEMPWHMDSYIQAMRSLTRYLAGWSWLKRNIRAISAPALLVHGELDPVVSAASARRIASLRPDWEFVVLEGVGHGPAVEVPARWAEVVSGFLRQP